MIRTDSSVDDVAGCEVCATFSESEIRRAQQQLPCRCGMSAWYHSAPHPHPLLPTISESCLGFVLDPKEVVKQLLVVVEELAPR